MCRRVQRKSFLQLAILAQTSFQQAPKIFWWAELISQFFCKFNSSKYFTCQSGKLRTEFTSPIAKSTSPGLSDTTFFARCAASFFNCFVEIPAETFLSHSPAFSFQNSLGDKGCFTPFWEDELELDESEVLLRSSSESNIKKKYFTF